MPMMMMMMMTTNYQIMHISPRNMNFIFVSFFKTNLVTYKLHIFLSNSVSPLYAYIVELNIIF